MYEIYFPTKTCWFERPQNKMLNVSTDRKRNPFHKLIRTMIKSTEDGWRDIFKTVDAEKRTIYPMITEQKFDRKKEIIWYLIML